MKIGIEVQRLFRKRKFGIETSALELIKSLKEAEPRHEYVIFARDDEDRECLKPSGNLKIRTVNGKFFADFEQFFLPIAAQRERVDILHCTGNTTPLICRVPVVQTLHDVIFMDAIPSGDSFYQRFGNYYRRKVVPLVTPRSNAIITVSQYERERIAQRLGISRDRIQVIYNGINEERFNTRISPERLAAVRARYELPAKFILFLGNQTTRKNPSRVLEAYARYASGRVDAMPLVTPGLTKKFIGTTLQQLGSDVDMRSIITPGYIDDHDLAALYALSTLFLFPSLSEGFGLPLVEAMACGCPVISSDASCLPEIAGNAALLVNPLKADQMAAAIIALSGDEGLRRKKIEAGLSNAKRFNWKRSAESVLGVYEKVHAEAKALQPSGSYGKHVLATRE